MEDAILYILGIIMMLLLIAGGVFGIIQSVALWQQAMYFKCIMTAFMSILGIVVGIALVYAMISTLWDEHK